VQQWSHLHFQNSIPQLITITLAMLFNADQKVMEH